MLGHGDPGLTGLLSPRAKLRPDRVCLIGTRDFEPEEAALLRTLDVRVFYMDEVRSRGLERVLDDALEIVGRARRLRRHTGPGRHRTRRCPGVSTPSRTGCAATLLPGLRRLLRDRRCVGLEISEFNPSEDKDGRTLDFMLAVVANLVRDRAAGASKISLPLGIALVMMGTHGYGLFLFGAILPTLQARHGFDYTFAGMASATLNTAYMTGALLLGAFGRRLPAKRWFVLSVSCCAAAGALPLAPGPYAMLAAFIPLGMASAVSWSSAVGFVNGWRGSSGAR